MAKKKVVAAKEGQLPDPFEMMKAIDDKVEIAAESSTNIAEWISTGNYMLNACISGSLFGGVPSGKIISLIGESGCMPGDEKIEIYRFRNKNIKQHHDRRNVE